MADKERENVGAFSHKFRLISDMIVGGSEWLRAAIANTNDRYGVRTEAELLMRIQEGLHATGLIVVHRLDLLVDPLKLWNLAEEDLALLATAKKKDSVKDILKKYGLMDFKHLGQGLEMIDRLDVLDKPPFRIMSLFERLCLLELANEADLNGSGSILEPDVQKDAAGFAVEDAQSAKEFVDRFRFFTAVVDKFSTGPKKVRKKRVQVAWEDYWPLCDGLMETFSLGNGYESMDLSMEIKDRVSGGQRVGFLTKTSAMCNLMRNTGLKSEEQLQAQGLIASYMNTASGLVAAGSLEKTEIFQDGTLRLNFVSSLSKAGGVAKIDIDKRGTVTLDSCFTGPLK